RPSRRRPRRRGAPARSRAGQTPDAHLTTDGVLRPRRDAAASRARAARVRSATTSRAPLRPARHPPRALGPRAPRRVGSRAAARPAAFGDDAAGADPALHRSQHADYQADVALALAKRLKSKPRDVATAIAAKLSPDDVIERIEISGPGFLNITVRAKHLADA